MAWAVHLVPVLTDNYAYILAETASGKALVVDPAEADKVMAAASGRGLTVEGVLTTHHHYDHAGGNEDFVRAVPVPVMGGDPSIAALSRQVKHGDTIALGQLTIRVLGTPCHTAAHVCYFVDAGVGQRAVFTGDTLFLGGCGRFFEGSAQQMHTALNQVLAELPDDTQIFCGHEYTVGNLQYGRHAEPSNEHIAKKLDWAKEQRRQGLPTIPGTIGEEKLTNVFMRVGLSGGDPVEEMARLREDKNNWKPPAAI